MTKRSLELSRRHFLSAGAPLLAVGRLLGAGQPLSEPPVKGMRLTNPRATDPPPRSNSFGPGPTPSSGTMLPSSRTEPHSLRLSSPRPARLIPVLFVGQSSQTHSPHLPPSLADHCTSTTPSRAPVPSHILTPPQPHHTGSKSDFLLALSPPHGAGGQPTPGWSRGRRSSLGVILSKTPSSNRKKTME